MKRTTLLAHAALVFPVLACASASPEVPPDETPRDAKDPAVTAPTLPVPPVAAKHPVTRTLHGESFVDDYFWLRDKDTPAVLDHLRAEAAYADAVMAPLAPLRQTLYDEIVSHVAEDDDSAPVKDGKWRYWTRTIKGKDYPVYLRAPVTVAKGKPAGGAAEEVLLDMNVLAAGKAYLGLGRFEVSDDGTRLLYTTDETGFRQYDARVRDIASGKDIGRVISKVVGATWLADGKSFVYTVEDAAKRPYRAYRHVLGTDPKDDVLLYEEADGRFELYVWRARSKDYVVMSSESKLATEVRLLDARRPDKPLVVVAPRRDNIEYYVEPVGTALYIRTNDKGPTFRVVKAALGRSAPEQWKELVALRPDVMLEELELFKSAMVLETRSGGLPHLEVRKLDGSGAATIALPDPVYEVGLDRNPEHDTKVLRYAYTSLAVPRTIYTYDLATKTSTLVKEDPVPGGFDRTRYVAERIFAKAADGAEVPISIVRRKDVPLDGTAALHLYGYGSYGYAMGAAFSVARLAILDRGVIYAIAHIRGGGELGKPWHEAGRLGKKMNTFTDFITAAETLVAKGYTKAGAMTIEGHSAGGLLMGAVLNMRPELFKAAIVGVPFVDVINTMNDPTLPLTITEYEEWGNPGIAEQYAWMRPYSPYDNLAARAYPTLLVETSYNDSQVMYWEPAKYVARLRDLKTDTNPVIFRIHLEPAGHGGKSGRYDRFREAAYDQAFILWQHGLAP